MSTSGILRVSDIEWLNSGTSLVKAEATADILTFSSNGGTVELKGLTDPTEAQAAATKAYVDANGGSYTGGDGIDVSGSVISVDVDGDTLEFSSGELTIKSGAITNSMLEYNSFTLNAGDGLNITDTTVALNDTETLSVDSTVVRTTGDQSIAGVKTFSDSTDATSSTAGGTICSGGLAVAKKIHSGDVCTAVSFTSTSDARLKKDVEDLTSAESGEIIDSLRPVHFKWIDSNLSQDDNMGFIAQEVKDVHDGSVMENANGFLSVNYVNFISVLVAEVKELRARVADLEASSSIESTQQDTD